MLKKKRRNVPISLQRSVSLFKYTTKIWIHIYTYIYAYIHTYIHIVPRSLAASYSFGSWCSVSLGKQNKPVLLFIRVVHRLCGVVAVCRTVVGKDTDLFKRTLATMYYTAARTELVGGPSVYYSPRVLDWFGSAQFCVGPCQSPSL